MDQTWSDFVMCIESSFPGLQILFELFERTVSTSPPRRSGDHSDASNKLVNGPFIPNTIRSACGKLALRSLAKQLRRRSSPETRSAAGSLRI